MAVSDKTKQYLKERREWLHAHHLCVDCKQMDARTMMGRFRCFECSEKARIRETGQLHTREIRVELGLCSNCGAPVKDGFKVCESCHAHMVEMSRKSHEGHGPARKTDHAANPQAPRSQWIENGYCYLCGEKQAAGLKVCGACRDRLTQQRHRQKELGQVSPYFNPKTRREK